MVGTTPWCPCPWFLFLILMAFTILLTKDALPSRGTLFLSHHQVAHQHRAAKLAHLHPLTEGSSALAHQAIMTDIISGANPLPPHKSPKQGLPHNFSLCTLLAVHFTSIALTAWLWKKFHTMRRLGNQDQLMLDQVTILSAAGIRFLSQSQLGQVLGNDAYCDLLDIRSAGEVEEMGSLPDGIHIALIDATWKSNQIHQTANASFLNDVKDSFPDRGHSLIILCSDGDKRSSEAARLLADAGYTDVQILEGGFLAWYAARDAARGGQDLPSKDRTLWISWRQAMEGGNKGKKKDDPQPGGEAKDPVEDFWAQAREELRLKQEQLFEKRGPMADFPDTWEFSSSNPSRTEINDFLDWFACQGHLETYLLEPTITSKARQLIHTMASLRGFSSKSMGSHDFRCLQLSKKKSMAIGPSGKSVVPPSPTTSLPPEVKNALTTFEKSQYPVHLKVPKSRSWLILQKEIKKRGIAAKLIGEVTALVLSREPLVQNNPGRAASYLVDKLLLPEDDTKMLKSAIERAQASYQQLGADRLRQKIFFRKPIIPSPNASYPVNEFKRQSMELQRNSLPIVQHRTEILTAMAQHRVVILDGPTGSGKSTQVPQYIIDSNLLSPDSPVVIVTQPRRIAAVSLAQRVAEERGQQVGNEVGFQVRFSSSMGTNTRLIYMTSGILLRRLNEDPQLKGVGCVVVDEVHERTLEVDFILLLMKQAIAKGQTNARLVVMSATLQANVFAEYFASVQSLDVPNVPAAAKVNRSQRVPNTVHFEGRTFPVKDFYLEEALAWTGFSVDERSGKCTRNGSPPKECRKLLENFLTQAYGQMQAQEELSKVPPAKAEILGAMPMPTDGQEDIEQETEEWAGELDIEEVEEEMASQGSDDLEIDDDGDEDEENEALSAEDEAAMTDQEAEEDVDDESDLEAEVDEYLEEEEKMAIQPLMVQSDLIAELILALHATEIQGAILVFLPGLKDIRDVRTALFKSGRSQQLMVLTLHSMVPLYQQRALFTPPPQGQRKVILSTNIAESSITVDDVIFVIDSGLMKAQQYNARNNLSSIDYMQLSKASIIQRRGRAGRVQPGIAIHLFPRESFESLPDSLTTELRRVPLEEVCLQLKSLGFKNVHRFLSLSIDPPKPRTIRNALQCLKQIGALTRDNKEELTSMGRLLAAMPLHPAFGKMLLLAALFGVLEPVATIVAILSNKSPYIHALGHGTEARLRNARWGAVNEDVPDSDFVLLLNLFDGWSTAPDTERFCMETGLSTATMLEIQDTRKQHLDLFKNEMKFGDSAHFNRHASNMRLISNVISMCMYPNVAHRKQKRWWSPESNAFVVASPNSRARVVESLGGYPYLSYAERRAFHKSVLVDNASFVSLFPVILSACNVQPVLPVDERDGGFLICDDWLIVRFDEPELMFAVYKAHSLTGNLLEAFSATRTADDTWVLFFDELIAATTPGGKHREDGDANAGYWFTPKNVSQLEAKAPPPVQGFGGPAKKKARKKTR